MNGCCINSPNEWLKESSRRIIKKWVAAVVPRAQRIWFQGIDQERQKRTEWQWPWGLPSFPRWLVGGPGWPPSIADARRIRQPLARPIFGHREAVLCLFQSLWPGDTWNEQYQSPLLFIMHLSWPQCFHQSPKRRCILTSWPRILDAYSKVLTAITPQILDVLDIFYRRKNVRLGGASMPMVRCATQICLYCK